MKLATDDNQMLREKMLEYMDAGVDVEVRSLSTELSGGNLLPGFKLSLSRYLLVVEIFIKVKSRLDLKEKPNPPAPFPAREGGEIKASLLAGERFGERFSRCCGFVNFCVQMKI
ncbi:MAG: hypothetical protein WBA39_00105 [Rivularia sp. (in: cyanobacteria)]